MGAGGGHRQGGGAPRYCWRWFPGASSSHSASLTQRASTSKSSPAARIAASDASGSFVIPAPELRPAPPRPQALALSGPSPPPGATSGPRGRLEHAALAPRPTPQAREAPPRPRALREGPPPPLMRDLPGGGPPPAPQANGSLPALAPSPWVPPSSRGGGPSSRPESCDLTLFSGRERWGPGGREASKGGGRGERPGRPPTASSGGGRRTCRVRLGSGSGGPGRSSS